ncbi:hypothetical protein VOI32_14030 [Paraburkholderia caribensis]|uniref:Uncharacterized protein n=1 Tax=Paraburkholderia caribensis TaxID=75105 RepID=A0A9Q6RZ90_9BURK|nr:hypothetical protein [Paraburkholderia caribensis]MCO4881564.1 hypothetical protein [Paraburkholderia caribensis]PTB24481.1 hypothetical protein C9I56_33495 [Paraburkholderia caribensis]QLB61616.1 hypothetical protein A9O66_03985 [Paraburkholderia caribensis]
MLQNKNDAAPTGAAKEVHEAARIGAIHVHLSLADDPAFVLMRTSASPNPECKPPMKIARANLQGVLLMLLDAANSQQNEGPRAC